jgi:hypothetical protein
VPNNEYSDLGAVAVAEPTDYSGLGAIPVPKETTQIGVKPKKNFIDTIKNFFRDPEADIAKAQNVYALSKATGLNLKDTYNNYDLLRRSSKVTGLTPDLESREYMAIAMTPLIATAAVANPIGTAAGLLAYAALDKAIPTDKIVKSVETGLGTEFSGEVKTAIDLIDFIGKGLIVGGVFKKAPQLAEGFIKNKLVEYNMAKDITLSAKQVRDIYQTGKLTTRQEAVLFGSLELKGAELKTALEKGVKISIPPEKIVSLVDKPGWAKFKKVLGMASEPKVTTDLAGKPKQAPARSEERRVGKECRTRWSPDH